MLMRVRLAIPKAYRPEAERLVRALARHDVQAELVAHGSEAELELRSAEGLTETPPPGASLVLRLPEPRDALVAVRSVTLEEVPEGGAVGFSGALRREMLGVHRPDLRAVGIEDAGTAADLLAAGDVDAWIAPVRETRRAGLAARTGEVFEPTSWATGAGRGVLVVLMTGRAPEALRDVSNELDDAGARAALTAELATLDALGAGHAARVGVMARPHGELLRVRALVPAAAGRRLVRAEISGSQADPRDAGRRTAAQLLDRGAAELLGAGSAR